MLGGLKRLRLLPASFVGSALAAAALGIVATAAPACALIAGLETHTLEAPDGGTGGSSSSTVSSSTGGAGGTGGSGGATRAWPDSSTLYCSDGTETVSCPTKATDAWHGQDGDFKIHVPVYQTTTKLVTDTVTGLMWRRLPLPVGAEMASAQLCSLPFENFSDWRLPSRIELVSLIDYGTTGAHIDHTAFPDVAAKPLVSSTSVFSDGQNVWGVDLGCTLECAKNTGDSGNTVSIFATNPNAALCVRGEPLVTGTFQAPVNGTVTDTSTGLVWQVSVPPTQTDVFWTDALQQCAVTLNQLEFGNFTDWRLPSIKELQTIVDDQAVSPALSSVFPTGGEGYLWSSTPNSEAVTPVHVYAVLLADGSTTTLLNTDHNGAPRCVRGP